MKKTVGIILILASLFIGYHGFNKLNNSEQSVNLLGLELTAEDSGSKSQAFLMLGFGAVALLGGIYLVGKSKK